MLRKYWNKSLKSEEVDIEEMYEYDLRKYWNRMEGNIGIIVEEIVESKQRAPINWLPPCLPNPPWLQASKFCYDHPVGEDDLVDNDDQLDEDYVVNGDDKLDDDHDDDDQVMQSQTDSLK